ncbi:LytR/AlgR family response regulator transcription factor [Taibaiella chishuiensis]|uniref:LytTR family two component transcriptional regulator n=1 Tax=Taibaiella chishuiensis TaxID=1434707 RepID=A0A2P8D7R3_9BACT|nr:response regulator transcription factor [Taibaiella chishuiensis]PSK93275.1 LytTR family two component transcriptional regulator [Taibaiella chishuiensis]
MIQCLIIDDEQPAINIIAAYVEKVPYLKLVATTTDPLEGLSLINEKDIDLIFLDIQMPGLTGLEFVKAINGKCKVIFTTAYSQYALDGFDLDIIDYLLKPVPFTRFLKATQKAKEIIDAQTSPKAGAHEDFIIIQGDSKGKLIKVEINEIDYIEGMRNYVAIICGDRKLLSLMNMKDLEESLSSKQFIRVHKSFIVPIANIAAVDGNAIILKRNNKAEIILGNVYRPAFLEMMRSRMIH